MARIESVDRDGQGEARQVVIQVEDRSLMFILQEGGQLRVIGRGKHDRRRLNRGGARVSPGQYRSAVRRARGVFNGHRGRGAARR
ncbi:MAG: hypothetical protein PHH01_03795 [Patescibacteria group bacterium]|nr:hypothetical protein [Patescibacteria group bacterium]MDD5567289.1 hypothetical protein [Patescibacteria group bacterium]